MSLNDLVAQDCRFRLTKVLWSARSHSRNYDSQHPSLMPFSTYLYKKTLSSPKSAKARKAALKAVVSSLYEQGGAIERKFGIQEWVVVL